MTPVDEILLIKRSLKGKAERMVSLSKLPGFPFFIVVIFPLLFLCGCGNNVKIKTAETREMLGRDIEAFVPDKTVTYKQIGDVKLALHIFNPPSHASNQKRPAIVSFFGGGWNGGSINQFYRQSEYWASRGMVAICAEYRVRSRHKVSPFECLKDAKSAMRWVRSHAEELGIDPERIAACGGSAGGHLAVAAATAKKFNAPSDNLKISPAANALVLFNPVYDNSPEGYGYDRVQEQWQDFSPMHNIDENIPPAIVFLGTKDKLVPVSTAQKFKEKMEAVGSRCDLFLYDGQEHAFFNHYSKDNRYFFQTLLESDRFLTSLGYLKGDPWIEDQNIQ